VAQADGADVGVWLCTIFIWATAESFGVGVELDVAFDTDDSFEISLHYIGLMIYW
jgi:hypothetical protein